MSLDDADRWEREQFRREQADEDWQRQMGALERAKVESRAARAKESRERLAPRKVTPVRGIPASVRFREPSLEELAERAAIDEHETSGAAWRERFAAQKGTMHGLPTRYSDGRLPRSARL